LVDSKEESKKLQKEFIFSQDDYNKWMELYQENPNKFNDMVESILYILKNKNNYNSNRVVNKVITYLKKENHLHIIDKNIIIWVIWRVVNEKNNKQKI